MAIEHDPYYDGRIVFTLDVGQLQPGDVILTRNRQDENKAGRAQSSIIAAAGLSNFSHALICSQPPTLIEAIGSGVSTLSVARSFYHAERDVRVLRYHDAGYARRAAAKAGLFIGKGYSVRMAVQSVLPRAADALEPMVRTFCSALVAAAFRGSGAPEFQTVNPYRTTPGGLTRMPFLSDVTSLVQRSLLAPKNIEEMTALDGIRQPSPFDGQAGALFKLHAAVANEVQALIRDWNLSLEVPTTYFETLHFLVSALKSASAGDDPLKAAYLRALLSIDRKLAVAFDESGLDVMNEDANGRETEVLARDLLESFQEKPDIDIDAVCGMLGATAGQIKSRGWVLEEQHRAAGISLSWDQWCNLSALNIRALERRQAALSEVIRRVAPHRLSHGQ